MKRRVVLGHIGVCDWFLVERALVPIFKDGGELRSALVGPILFQIVLLTLINISSCLHVLHILRALVFLHFDLDLLLFGRLGWLGSSWRPRFIEVEVCCLICFFYFVQVNFGSLLHIADLVLAGSGWRPISDCIRWSSIKFDGIFLRTLPLLPADEFQTLQSALFLIVLALNWILLNRA